MINKKAKAVHVLNGRPKELTKNNSIELDRFNTTGKTTLKIKPNIIIDTMLAQIKPFSDGFCFLKQYIIKIAGRTSSTSKWTPTDKPIK